MHDVALTGVAQIQLSVSIFTINKVYQCRNYSSSNNFGVVTSVLLVKLLLKELTNIYHPLSVLSLAF